MQSAWFSKCLVFIGELKTGVYSRNGKFPLGGVVCTIQHEITVRSTGGGVFYYCTFVAAMERPWQQLALLDLPLFYYTNADNL